MKNPSTEIPRSVSCSPTLFLCSQRNGQVRSSVDAAAENPRITPSSQIRGDHPRRAMVPSTVQRWSIYLDAQGQWPCYLRSETPRTRSFRAIYRARELGCWRVGKRTFREIEIELIVPERWPAGVYAQQIDRRGTGKRREGDAAPLLHLPPFFSLAVFLFVAR